MKLADLWSDCCDYLEKEGWGDIGLLRLNNPKEYEHIRKSFKEIARKFSSSSDESKGSGELEGFARIPPCVPGFLSLYNIALLFSVGDLFRRYMLVMAIKGVQDEIRDGSIRKRREIDRMANLRLAFPKTELLRLERRYRPKGADMAVSRASKKIHVKKTEQWRSQFKESPLLIGIAQFFLWKYEGVTKEKEKIAGETAEALVKEFNKAFNEATEEIEKYGIPNDKEIQEWSLKYHKELKEQIRTYPELARLIYPLIFLPDTDAPKLK
jgi:hypothetical protein